MVLVGLAGVGADGVERLPGDPQDHDGHDQADDRVSDLQPERDDRGAEHDRQADQPVSPGVIAVGDQRRALQPLPGTQPDERGSLVTDEPDRAGGGERPQVRESMRVDQAVDRLDQGNTRTSRRLRCETSLRNCPRR